MSVLKNYLQINNGIQNSNIVAFDINEINPNFKDLKYLEKNDNNLFYFKGSVLSNADAEGFKLFFEEILGIDKNFPALLNELSS